MYCGARESQYSDIHAVFPDEALDLRIRPHPDPVYAGAYDPVIVIEYPDEAEPSFYKRVMVRKRPSEISGAYDYHSIAVVETQDIAYLFYKIFNVVAVALLSEPAEIIKVLTYL